MPTYEEIMLPFLKHLADGKVHTLKEIKAILPGKLIMTEEEKTAHFRLVASLCSITRQGGQEHT